MSTTAHLRTSRFADTLGVLAIVTGLVLGLVPGIGPVSAEAAPEQQQLDQCANDSSKPVGERDDCNWQNGNLNAQNSVYAEGDSVGFRSILTGLVAGREYELPINYDILNSGYIAYDQLTSWDRTEFGAPAAGTPATTAIPHDPYAAHYGIPRATPAVVSLYGGTWLGSTPVEYKTAEGPLPSSGTAKSELVFRFTANATTVTLAWGGHIALRQDWNETDANGGAFATAPQTTNGSPYHMRFGASLGEREAGAPTFTYSTLGQQDRSLKADAVILPGTIRIVKQDVNENLLSGFTFTISGNGITPITCTTDVSGICLTSTELQPGTYTVTETAGPAGYTLDTTPRSVVVEENETTEVTYTNQRVDYVIDVAPDGRNAVGNSHTFTVTLTAGGQRLVGATIDPLAWTGAVGSITGVNGGAAATSCTTRADNTATPQNEAGTCVVTVTSSSPGSGTLTATYSTPYQYAEGTAVGSTGGANVATITDTATKTWVGYVASITPTETNLASNSLASAAGVHTFTAHVQEKDGSGTLPNASGVVVKVSWTGYPSGASIVSNSPNPAAQDDPLQCVTGSDGKCTFTVDSTTAGAGVIEIIQLNGTILGLDQNSTADDEPLQVTDPKTSAGEEPTARKTWREYRAKLDGDSVNPVDQAHKFTVTVQYREVEGGTWTDAGSGLFVDWTTGATDVGSDLAASTCDDEGTDDNGKCEIWVKSTVVGSRTVTLTEVSGALLPNDSTTYTFPVSASQFRLDDTDDDADNVATKTWLNFTATITPTEHNQVGESHIFTVEIGRSPDNGGNAVPNKTLVSVTPTWLGEGALGDVSITDNCGTTGTVDDKCTVVVNSDAPGKLTITVDGVKYYPFDGVTDDITFATKPFASKTWWDYRAWVEPSATNVVGDPHTFKVHAQRNSGGGWEAVQDMTIVDVEPSADGVGSITTNDCEDTSVGTSGGTCDVIVTSLTPGQLELNVLSVQAKDAVNSLIVDGDGKPVADVSGGDNLNTQENETGQSTSATKTWVEYSATISGDATNLVGEDHPFKVLAFVDFGDGSGDVPVDAGTKVKVSLSDDSYRVHDTCANGTGNDTDTTDDLPDETAANECWVVVGSGAVGSVDVTVGEVEATNVTATEKPYDSVADSNATSTKTWIAALVNVSPTETNVAGESHTFDVDVVIQVPTDDPNDSDGIEEVDDINGATVDVKLGASTTTGSITSSSCDDSDGSSVGDGTVGGTCQVTVHSADPGQLVLTATGVQFRYDGKDFDVNLGDLSNDGVSPDQTSPALSATKTWRAYSATLEADDLNRVRDEHPFTVTVKYTDDGENWSLADLVDVTVDKVSGVGDVTDGTCTTGELGTCTVTVNSTVAGTGTFEVDQIVVDHPEDGADHTLGGGGTTDVAFDNDDTADKTWAAFRAWLSRDSANITGDEHRFTVTAEYTVGGGTWLAVPDGTTIDVSDAGTGSGAGSIIDTAEFNSTCGDSGTTGGTCDVWVDSASAGTLDVGIDGLSAMITINEGTDDEIQRTFNDVTFGYDGDGPDADPNPGLLDGFDTAGLLVANDESVSQDDNGDYVATKAWASYQLRLDPVKVTNLLDVTLEEDPEENHTITATLTSDDEDGIAPILGQEIRFDIDAGATITATDGGQIFAAPETDGADATCVTNATGTCTITITRDTPGEAVVNAWYSATVGDSAAQTIPSDTTATKIWTTFRLTVTPDRAVNLVDSPHNFRVTLWESILTADCGEDAVDGFCRVQTGDAIAISVPGDTAEDDLTVNTTDCDDGTNAQGQCVVTVTSGSVRAITLTATYREPYASYDSAQASIDAVFAEYSGSGDKSWIDYDIDVVGDADNLVNNPHTFTVQLSTIVPDGEGGTTSVGIQGAKPQVVITSGPGSIVPDTDTCASVGTVVDEATPEVGTCTVTITSAVAGVTTVDASYVGYARIDGDTIADDPQDESRTYDTFTSTEDDSGEKQWVDYLLEVTPNAVNAVGDEHDFTATLSIDTGDGFGPAAGEELTWAVDGVGSIVVEATDGASDVGEDLTCTTNDKGQCTLSINSQEAGATDVSVSYGAVVGTTSRTDTENRTKQWVDIELVKTAVTGDGFSDGDLIADPGGFPFLAFTSSDQGPKTAVFEYEIHNPSNVTLENVVLKDDRLGTIDLADFPACQTLDPGETCIARASEQFDYFDATASLASLITNVGTVTATGGGERVSAFDDATITLVAVQSSILIDLVKDVVAGAGDVQVVDGRPIVNWSEAEYKAGVSKTVRYRFTVTNISNSPIIDVELIDPMISDEPIIAKADGVTLQPDEQIVVEVDHVLTVDEAFPDGPIASKVDNVATVSGANETRDSFSQDTDDASVFSEIVFAVVKEKPLPATGLNGGLLPVSMLLIAVGAAVLWLDRRRTVG